MLFEHITMPRRGDQQADKRRRLAAAVAALDEAKLPRPVKGGFTIPATARGDKIAIDVLKASIYDNTWAIEKGKGGYLLFHIQSGAMAGTFKKAADAKTALQAAYDIAPPASWKFSDIKSAPQDLLNRWGETVSKLRYRPSGYRDKGIGADPKNRRDQTAGIKTDIPGFAKLAWKAIVKSAKEAAKREVQTAYHATPHDYKPTYKTRDHIRPKAGWPTRVDAKDHTTLWGSDVKYRAHGISQGDAEATDLVNWRSLSKKATATFKASPYSRTSPKAKYKLTVHIKDAEWEDVQGDLLIKVSYMVVATKA
jgi:hypothetical protein